MPLRAPVIRPDLDQDLVEARLAARLASALRETSELLPADVQERLRFARQQALARLPVPGGNAGVGRTAGGTLMLGRLDQWWPRLGALLPVLVLAWGAWLVDDARLRDEHRVAVAIDVALLADDLPPEAYADPGFVAFLNLQQP